ncbi:hypothetical protein BGZ94_007221 [Podila epigama]|nr:hypothetical protein BGZ94_007221 [Podila epigama]
MFCPRLDSALVASIFNDIGDFKATIPILSSLAAETVPTTTQSNDTPAASSTQAQKRSTTTTTATRTFATTTKPTKPSSKTSLSSSSKASDMQQQKNILIWSTEVANSNAGATADRKMIGAYPTTTTTTTPKAIDAARSPSSSSMTTTTATPAKQAFRAVRNPNYMKKHMPPPPPEPEDQQWDDTEQDEESIKSFHGQEEEEEQKEHDHKEPTTQESHQLTDQPSKNKGPKKKKKKPTGTRKQRNDSENANATINSVKAPHQRRPWKKDAAGQFSLTSQVENGLPEMTLSDEKSDPQVTAEEQIQIHDDEQDIQSFESSYGQYNSGEGSSRQGTNAQGAEELSFLKSCFPDRNYSDEYLAQVLKDSNRDLEAAVEMILSQMFLENEQVEVSSSGSGSRYSLGSQVTQTTSTSGSSLDDSFFQGSPKPKKAAKNMTVWGTPVHNPTTNIFGNVHNDPLMLAMEGQDEFLIPESNEWATFEHQIGILLNIFPAVPRKVIVSEYHANGTNLFRTVESVEERLRRENYMSSDEGRYRQSEFDVRLAQLMEMFPNHTAVGLKKVLIYNGNNFNDAMNAVLAADFAQAEMHSTMPKKYATVIPLQADVRFSDSTRSGSNSSNRLKSLPSTHSPFPGGQRMFPNTILDTSNSELYNDEDDPMWCRQQAHETLDQRNELFRKAARAYKEAKNKGVGMGGIAAYYADEGKKLDAQGKQWHMRAARAVVQQHRLENNDPNLVDLHGLTIAEAQTVVKEAVTQWFSRATMQAHRIAAKPLKIICGVGSHSKDRIARLYPTILNLLQKDGWRVEAENGVILVKGVSRLSTRS